MGVQGLWQLLQPTGKAVTLESLEGKVLAVDISIWLHHMVKGMRDGYGNSVPNAHLLGLFNRICKLLFYRIKPIFVFDGGVPELKKQTMTLRRQRKEEANVTSSKAAKKLLGLMLKQHAVSTVLGTGPSQSQKQASQQSSSLHCVPTLTKQTDPDPFQLRPLSEAERPLEPNEENDLWEERMAIREEVYVGLDDLEDIDIESDDFKSLPPEIQHEILTDLKEARKWTCYLKTENLPTKSNDFSSYQLQKLVKQNHLTRHIERVRKQMMLQESGDVTTNLTSANHIAGEIVTNRIISEDSSHQILIKGLRTTEDDEEKKVKDSKQAIQEIFEQAKKESRLRQEAKAKLFSDGRTVVEESESTHFKSKNEECSDNSQEDQDEKSIKESNNQSIGTSCSESTSKTSVDKRDKVPPSAYRQLPTSNELKLSDDDDDDDVGYEDKSSSSMDLGKEQCSESSKAVKPEYNPTGNDIVINEVSENQNVELGKRHALDSGRFDDKLKLPRTEPSTSPNSHLNEETGEISEDENDFIEISVDPYNIKPDEELFPSSVFTQVKDDSSKEKGITEESRHIPQTEEADELTVDSTDDSVIITDDNEFEGMSHSELLELQNVLELQASELQSVKQQQERAGTTITDQMYVEAQELLELFGLPYLISPMEAEAQCAFLDQTNQTQGTITDDSDIWLFGGKRVYKNFFNQKRHVEFYQIHEIQKQMFLDRVKMVNLALLCGSDYTDGIQGVGPVTAMEILGEFPGSGLTPLLDFKKWWDCAQKEVKVKQETKVKSKLRQLLLSEGFPNKAVAEAYFNPTVDDSDESFSWGIPDLEQLRDYSSQKFGWTTKKADEVLLPVIKQINEKQHQQRITNYVITESADNMKVKSKRVRRILNRMRTDGVKDSSESSTECKSSDQPKTGAACKMIPHRKYHKVNASNTGTGGGWMQMSAVAMTPKEQEADIISSSSESCPARNNCESEDHRCDVDHSGIPNDNACDEANLGHCRDQSQNQDQSHNLPTAKNIMKNQRQKTGAKTCSTSKGRRQTGKQKRSSAGQRTKTVNRVITDVKLSESDSDTD